MPTSSSGELEALSAGDVLEYAYKRSLGPVIGRFLGGVKARRIEAVKTAAGRVIAPPVEYDPDTGEDVDAEARIAVGPGGVVTTWAWEREAKAHHPVSRPFAWALVRLDGADTGMLHAVDVGGDEGKMKSGMRVAPRWRAERTGTIRDLECFVPEEEESGQGQGHGQGHGWSGLRRTGRPRTPGRIQA